MNDSSFLIYSLLSCLLIGALCLFVNYAWRTRLIDRIVVRRFLRRPYREPNEDETEVCVEEALRCMNVHFDKHKSDDVDFLDYTFRFQDGNFVIIVQKENTRMLRILFPNIYEGKIDDIDMVRSCCNDFNRNFSGVTAFYDIDQTTKDVRVHLECGVPRMTQAEELAFVMTKLLQECFSTCRALQQLLEQTISFNRRANCMDREYVEVRDDQFESLIDECEVRHGASAAIPEGRFRLGKASSVTLGSWLDTMDYLIGCDIKRLRIVSPQGTVFETEELSAIEHFCLKDAVTIRKDDNGIVTGCDDVTLEVLFEPFAPNENPSGLSDLHTLRLFFRAEKVSKAHDTLYVRMTYVVPQCGTLNPQPESHFDQNIHPISGSQLIAVNLASMQTTQAELRFMLGDALDKMAEGKQHELTPEQHIMLRFQQFDEEYLVAKGNRFFREKCYIDAVYCLTQVWQRVNARMTAPDKSEHPLLLDLSEWIGTSLYKLGLYQKAFYYIDMLQMKSRSDYAMLYVDCLIAMKDWRALPWINDRITDVKNQMQALRQNDEEVPLNAHKFLNFLLRRQIHVMVELGQLDEAEEACKKIMRSANYDFTLTELAHIKQLRKEKDEDKKPDAPETEEADPFAEL